MTSSTYQGAVISIRSRRLRTVFSLLLVVILGMSIYGIRVLMPALQKTTALVRHVPSRLDSPLQGAEALSASPHLKHLLRVQILFSYAYWSVCFILFLSLLFVAWLDLREVTRNYTEQRRKIWTDPSLEGLQKRRPAAYEEDADRTTRIPVDEESESKEE